ncbi:universal stress protein [Streptomyces iakyrus]|uniref:universal stress protein n=1 Tax=Streptomyces iakyrus TaxID=68219 RepID=UPI00381F1A8B
MARRARECRPLVTGSQGLSGLGKFVFGSVAMATVARSKHPVVMVRTGETENLPEFEGKSPRSACPAAMWR